MSQNTIYLIIFIIVMSTAFPLMGYYLDWRHHRKMRTLKKDDAETDNDTKKS